MRRTAIYFASKRRHADLLRKSMPEGMRSCGRWLETANLAINATKPASDWMEENFSDIRDSDFVIVYAETGETLNWALGEVGWAMAYGKPVIVIGTHESYMPWRANPARVSFAPSLEVAFKQIKQKVEAPKTVLNAAGETVQA